MTEEANMNNLGIIGHNPESLPFVKERKKAGPKTKAEKLEMISKIRMYFSKGIPAAVVARLEPYNRKTIRAYYREFAEKIQEHEEKDWIQTQNDARSQTITAMGEQLAMLYRVQKDVEDAVDFARSAAKMEEKPRNYLTPEEARVKNRIDICNAITNLLNLKHSIECAPVITEVLRNQIDKLIADEKKKAGLY